jgi:hypothetical protein
MWGAEESDMRAINIEAKDEASARAFCAALASFSPSFTRSEREGYTVSVDVAGGDEQIVALLNALEKHVKERAATGELGDHPYVIHPDLALTAAVFRMCRSSLE